jgi:two-component system OmpR family response regulator
MRVLVVEDDRRLADALDRGLSEAGFVVVWAGDSDEALAAGISDSFDVIVLDVMLPGTVSGFEVAARLRGSRVSTPILMLTGRDAVEDRIKGLESGADDYLLKPFAFGELVARLRALSRRHLPGRSAVLHVGDVRFDTASRTIAAANRPVSMTAKELAILELFLLHPGQVLSREQILHHAWDDEAEWGSASNVVEVFVSRVRRKLVAAGIADPITTVRGAGYRMDTPVQ